MQFISMKRWLAYHKEKNSNDHIVDLRAAKDRSEVIKILGRSMRAIDSPAIDGNSLDALNDVMSDWFIENWGKKKSIYILGWDVLRIIDVDLPVVIADVLNFAFLGAIYDRCLREKGSSVCDEINALEIYLVKDSLPAQ